jgi:hypothetical protein
MFRSFSLFVLLALGSSLASQRATDEREPRPTSGGAEPAGQTPACIRVTTSAPFRGLGYDHTVTLQSSCEVTADCSVKTDVNPAPTEVVVPPSKTVDVITWRGSPAYEFQADVSCKLRS